MGLLGNYSVILKSCGTFTSGPTISDNRANYNSTSQNRKSQIGTYSKLSAIPNGYNRQDAWLLPVKSGSVSVYNGLSHGQDINISVAGGVNGSVTITTSIDITNAQLGLIVSAISDLASSLGVEGAAVGILNAVSSISQSQSISLSLGAIANCISSIISSAQLNGNTGAFASASADITSFTALSPQNLAKEVWNALATQFNNAGTMGNKLNSAASAGDPWSANLPSTYTGTQAGNILAQIQELVTELHKIQGLDDQNPMMVTPTLRSAGSIILDITGDGVSSTTVTRL